MKSYTDIEQSKKLAEILPLESADMAYYQWKDDSHLMSPVPFILDGMEEKEDGIFEYVPCWSLSALLNVIPKHIKDYNVLRIDIDENNTAIWYDEIGYGVNNDLPDITMESAVDACVAMIEKLHELKLL